MSLEKIKASGLKNTKARVNILDYFEKTPGKHHTAEDLQRYFVGQDDAISLATIYRVLRDLESSELLVRHRFEADLSVYELAHDEEHHDHLVCQQCKKVVEFYDQVIESRQEKIAKQHGFILKDHRLVLFGLCSACRD